VNISDLNLDTISANDFSFYEAPNAVVQSEPADWVDPDTVGPYASIGIRKGQPFAPDERMKKILTDAVAVGSAIARTSVFAPRDPAAKIYPDQQWQKVFVGNSYRFLNGAERLLDARIMSSTTRPPARSCSTPGTKRLTITRTATGSAASAAATTSSYSRMSPISTPRPSTTRSPSS
jgi:hypothetical protein